LSDPTTGHLTIGCPESIAATELPWIAERFSKEYPRVVLQVEDSAANLSSGAWRFCRAIK